MVDHSQMKLGKLSARPADAGARIMLRDFAAPALPAPPLARDWTAGATKRPIWSNDSVGDCTCCAIANIVMDQLAVVYGSSWAPTTAQVLALYSAVTGYNPNARGFFGAANPTDRGAVIADVVAYVLEHGFGGHHFVGAGAIDSADLDMIKRAIDWFGAVDLGVELPLAWQSATAWRKPPTETGSNKPGSWGGHGVCSSKYDAQYLYVWTWGGLTPVEWAAVPVYFDTVDAMVGAAWIKDGRSPQGLALDALSARLAQIAKAAA